jgi:tetratricopeptide (TPR) repeat protein
MAGKNEHLGWLKKAETFLEWKQYKQALSAIEKAIKAKPNHPESWKQKGNTLLEMEDYGGAITAFEKMIKITPDSTEGWVLKSTALEESGDVAAAEANFQAAVANFPDEPGIIFLYGVFFNRQKRYEEALVQFEQASTFGVNPFLLTARSAALEYLERYDEALADLDRIEMNYGQQLFMVSQSRGDLLVKLERYEEAEEAYSTAIELQPQYPFLWVNLGLLLEKQSRYDDAIAHYDTALVVLGDDAIFMKVQMFSRLKRYDDALKALAGYLALYPDDGVALYEQAIAYNGKQQIPEALASLRQAIAIDHGLTEDLAEDADFANLRENPEFQALLET